MFEKIGKIYSSNRQGIVSYELTRKQANKMMVEGTTKEYPGASYFSFVNQGDTRADFYALLEEASRFQNENNFPVLVHLRLGDLNQALLPDFVKRVKTLGICNFLVLSGDKRVEANSFSTVEELLTALRQAFGDTVSLGATFSLANPMAFDKAISREKAGADFFISQILFESENLRELQIRLQEANQHVQLVAGMLKSPTVKQVEWVKKTFGLKVPEGYLHNPEITNKTVEKSLRQAGFSAFHFFTLPNF